MHEPGAHRSLLLRIYLTFRSSSKPVQNTDFYGSHWERMEKQNAQMIQLVSLAFNNRAGAGFNGMGTPQPQQQITPQQLEMESPPVEAPSCATVDVAKQKASLMEKRARANELFKMAKEEKEAASDEDEKRNWSKKVSSAWDDVAMINDDLARLDE